jgi:hypothetical protein
MLHRAKPTCVLAAPHLGAFIRANVDEAPIA